MTLSEIATLSALDLQIADTQGKISYTVLPTKKAPKKSMFGVRLQGNKRRTKLQATDTQYRCCLSGRRSDQY
jgi:hypothetical protein